MKKLKLFLNLIIFFSFSIQGFAQNVNSLIESTRKSGITYYWDSLSETGILEKNGHQITFRKDESILVLDSMVMIFSDAPELKNNQMYLINS